jgi:hypothetical protein
MSQPDRASRNALVPYLDLFDRLDDVELARIAGVQPAVVAGLREQVDAVQKAFAGREELLPMLRDSELARMLGADVRTIQFWRLTCLPPARQSQPDRAGVTNTQMMTDHVVGPPSVGDLDPQRGPATAPRDPAGSATDLHIEMEEDESSASQSSGSAPGVVDDDDDDMFSSWSDL